MLPDDMFSPGSGKVWEADEVRRLWPSARGELLGFANALDRGGSGITADQLRMAIHLADKQFDLMVAPGRADKGLNHMGGGVCQ